MDTAVKLFAAKGYHATSIQDIADALGIAKGALYFYFKSKEDLLVQIITHYLNIFQDEFVSIMEDETRDARQRLAKQIILKSERLSDNRDFIEMFIKEKFEVNEDIRTLLHELNVTILRATERCVIALYGEEIRPYASDAAILFNAIVDGYLGTAYMQQSELDYTELSDYLIARLDDMVAGLLRSRPRPIISHI